jgi:hypothetical protein
MHQLRLLGASLCNVISTSALYIQCTDKYLMSTGSTLGTVRSFTQVGDASYAGRVLHLVNLCAGPPDSVEQNQQDIQVAESSLAVCS